MTDILGITIHEVGVAITDLVLFAESFLFAYLLGHKDTISILLKKLFMVMFLSLAASSFLGAIFHAFFPAKLSTTAGFGMWILVTASIGVTASAIWCINALLIKGEGLLRLVFPLSVLYLATLVYWVAFIDHSFFIIILFYLPAIVVFILISLFMYLRNHKKAWAYLFAGLTLSLLAATVQQSGIVIHPRYFDHNALFHVIQAVALLLIFLGARFLLLLNQPSGIKSFSID